MHCLPKKPIMASVLGRKAIKHFAELFKYQRGLQRISLMDLAEQIGLDAAVIQDIEDGKVLPSKIQMEKLAACPKLGLSYETLVEWKESELKNHWRELGLDSTQQEKWICPFRRWDCPCCNFPYSLKCEFATALRPKEPDRQTKEH